MNLLDVFVCYSPADQQIAETLKARLDRGAEANVWLEPCGRGTNQTMANAWDGGLSSAGILLLVSPDAIPERPRIEDWRPLLQHLERNAAPPLGTLLLNACAYPPLLERRRFFRWSDGAATVLRKLERWVIGLQQGDPPSFVPAPIARFEESEHELDDLWTALVDEPGTFLLDGNTALAQEFAHRASGHFRDIIWIACGERSQASIIGEIACQLRSSVDAVPELLRKHRLLLVLDDLRTDEFEIPAGGRTSVLKITGGQHSRPTVSCEHPLWHAMLACRPQDVRLDIAARVANMSEHDARAIAQHFLERQWIHPLDAAGTRFRLAATSAIDDTSRRRYAEVLHGVLRDSGTQPAQCRALMPDIEAALAWALISDWSIATPLGFRAGAYLNSENRFDEAASIYTSMRDAASARRDFAVAGSCSEELSWITDDSGATNRPFANAQQLRFHFDVRANITFRS